MGGLRDCTGQHFRNLLLRSVRALHAAGIDEIIIVTRHADLTSNDWPPVRIVLTPESGRFSEWDAKLVGIREATHDCVVTTNADIVVSRKLVDWFRMQVTLRPNVVFHGTKAWLNEVQTMEYLRSGTLNGCLHEVVVSVVDDTEVVVDGIEPPNWSARRRSAAHYLDKYGIDLWKHSGDFQAFHRALLDQVEYPLGSVGWGWGDSEFRLRVRRAGLHEVWNREWPVWHMYHPVRPWRSRRTECEANIRRWNSGIDLSLGGDGWALPPSETHEESRNRASANCASFPPDVRL